MGVLGEPLNRDGPRLVFSLRGEPKVRKSYHKRESLRHSAKTVDWCLGLGVVLFIVAIVRHLWR